MVSGSSAAGADAGGDPGKPVWEVRNPHGERVRVARPDSEESGSVFPKTLDHYKVYQVVDVGNVPDVTLKLRDQFGTSEVRLGRPLFFAVPVRKRHQTKEYPIQNERAHLLILAITPRNLEKKVTLRNQFARVHRLRSCEV